MKPASKVFPSFPCAREIRTLDVSTAKRTYQPYFDTLLSFSQQLTTHQMQRSVFAARKLSVRLNGLGQNTRKFSEYFHPFPSTAATPNGLYLMHAVRDSEFSTVKAALESGVDPNFRAEEVRPCKSLFQEKLILFFLPWSRI